jgi:hypothetical protein
MGLGFIVEVSRSQSHMPHSIRLLWTNDRPAAESSTWKHKTHKERHIHAPAVFEPAIPASQQPQTTLLRVRARRSLEYSLAGCWEPGKKPRRNWGCAQWCLFQACHSSWVIFEAASWQLDMSVETVYSSSCSDDEELLDSCASTCLLPQELPLRECQVHPVHVDRNNIRECHQAYRRLRNYLK